MDFMVVGIGLPALLVLLAVLLWLRPRVAGHRVVRRFRRELAHVDLMTVVWSQAFHGDVPMDDLWSTRPKRRRHRDREGDVPA